MKMAIVVIVVLIGLAVVSFNCAMSWVDGGSADPRCALGWRGYTSLRTLGATPKDDRISCQFRARLGAAK